MGDPMNKPLAILSSYIGVVIIAGIIFLAGGKLLYWQAQLYLLLAVLGTTLTHVLAPSGSNIAAQRARNAKAGEAWDRRILGLSFLLTIITFVVAGLDSGRFGWSRPMPLGLTIAGAAIMIAGQLIFALARRENAFFSSTVHIESERAHVVCSTGPYTIVRHPGYAGMILSLIGFPLVLGSYWSFIPVAASVALLVVRANLEDRFLQERLAGYREYSRAVTYKLLPFIRL